MVKLTLLCLLQSLRGPPKIILDTGTYQAYPINKRICPIFYPDKDTMFDLYTQSTYDSPEYLQIGNDSSVTNSKINFSLPTVMFIPGYLESSQSNNAIKKRISLFSQIPSSKLIFLWICSAQSTKLTKDRAFWLVMCEHVLVLEYIVAKCHTLRHNGVIKLTRGNFLRKGLYNIILVNNQRLLAGPYYVTSVINVEPIGKYAAKFVDFLTAKGLNRTNFHVIGMSLGAHVAGFVGKNVKGEKLNRITGLDPAGPGFDNIPFNCRLSKDDADFVDVIHTNAGIFGTRHSIGHVDVWFNGGRFQPGCSPIASLNRKSGSIAEVVFCNHYQAWRLFVKTIINPKEYQVTKCKNYRDFKKGKCNDNEKTYAGMNISRTARGDYFVNTGVTAVNV